MSKTIEKLERRRLLDVAREYRSKGFQVIIEPQPSDLPDFLAKFDVDLLARRADENVIVEVRSRRTLSGADHLPRVAEAVSNKPDWRFELVVTNPRNRTLADNGAVILSRRELVERIEQARELLDRKAHEAAMLLLWSAAEAALRHVAHQERVELEDDTPQYLVKRLYSAGLLDRKAYETLRKAYDFRSLIIHGYRTALLEPAFIKKLVRTLEETLQPNARGRE